MKKVLSLFFISALILIPALFSIVTGASVAFAEEAIVSAGEEAMASSEEGAVFDEQVYKFPEIKPKFSLTTGYRFVSSDGSKKAGKYEYLHNSIVLGGEVVMFPFPHRIHFEADALSRNDYFWDLSYAYKDTVISRWINRSLFHNLSNIRLYDINPATTNPRVEVADSGEEYGVGVNISTFFLRLKAPDFPLHFYIDSRYVEKKGTAQQIFIGGSGYRTDIARVSRKRIIDWDTREVAVGANSHMGPVEVDFSHAEKRFSTQADTMFADWYSVATGSRVAGSYPHNLIPATEGSTNTLKLHTSYTGRLVAGTTMSWTERHNRHSLASAEYFTGAGDIKWIPSKIMTLHIKYKYSEKNLDNPNMLPANYLGFSSGPYSTDQTNIRSSIDSRTNVLNGLLRVSPSKGFSLNLKYTFEETKKMNLAAWESNVPWPITDTTRRSIVGFTADAKPVKAFGLKLGYEHQEIDNPGHNIQPNRSDSGIVSATLKPVERATAFLSYSMVHERRGDIHYVGMQGLDNAKDRTARKNKFSGMLTLILPADISLTTGYSYFWSKIKQDLIYNNSTGGGDQPDDDAIYRDSARNYRVDLKYAASKRLDFNAGMSVTKSSSNYYPKSTAGVLPMSLGIYSALKLRETEYTLSGGYELKEGWRAGLTYKYNQFDDLVENLWNPEFSDGIAQTVMLTLSKRWQ